jgi:16S rRNA (cytosine1402-N4)-methyltransferase
MTTFEHNPVMVDEITAIFDAVPAGTIIDATLGGGGHSHALLKRRPDINILGIDQDADAIAAALERLSEFADRVRTSRRRFDQLDEAMKEHGVTEISGALFDLGVSSPQLDRPERGFSYRNDGPVDMRMDDEQQWSAHDVVNGYEVNELARVIRVHGDERFAKRIAEKIVAARPVESTTQLAEIVTTAIPAAARRTGGHPAKRTFQAIRIEVNSELDVLPDALDQAVAATVPCLPLGRAIARTTCPASAVLFRPFVWCAVSPSVHPPKSRPEIDALRAPCCELSKKLSRFPRAASDGGNDCSSEPAATREAPTT